MRNILTIFVSLVMVCAYGSFASSADVLLLGDNGAEIQVQTALRNAGHNVTYGGLYYDWNGISPNPNNFDVIVALDGEDYGYNFTSNAETALSGFVARGCGLVFTEWTAYDVCRDYKSAAIGQLMPVTMSSCSSFGYSNTWNVLNTTHPLTAGVPASWSDDAGWSTVNAKSGSTVLISGSDSNPLLTFSTANGGTVVYINHDMTYTTDTIDPNALQLIVNAVNYSSGCRQRTIQSVPTMTEWGMIIFIVLAGLGSVYYLKRQRRA